MSKMRRRLLLYSYIGSGTVSAFLVLRLDQTSSRANSIVIWPSAPDTVVRLALPKCLRPWTIITESLHWDTCYIFQFGPHRPSNPGVRRWFGEPRFCICG